MRNEILKRLAFVLFAGCVVAGCATSTVETRKKERAAEYAALAPEWRELVDQGQVKIGMPMDAVYLAWGKPTQTLTSESSSGPTTTWVYHGTSYQEYRYWSHGYYGGIRHRNGYSYALPRLEYDYIPSSFVAAQVVFEKGLAKSWQNLSPPRP